MAVAAVPAVSCAAFVAMGAAKLGHSEKYAHMVIDRERPTPVDDARDAVTRLPARRRVRVADIEGGLPVVMVVTLIGVSAHGI